MRPDTAPPIDPPQERHREEDQDESAASATRSMGDRPQGKPNRLPREVRAVRKGILQEEGFQKEMGQRRKDQIEILRQTAEQVPEEAQARLDDRSPPVQCARASR